jgi:hypothetical protein
MEEEMEEVRRNQADAEAEKRLKEKALRAKERQVISTPGSHREPGTPLRTPRRLGL